MSLGLIASNTNTQNAIEENPMKSNATQTLTALLLIAALTACGDDDGGGAGMAGSGAGNGGESGQGATGGTGGAGGDAGAGATGDDAGDSGQGGTGGDAGSSGTGGTGGDAGADSGVDAGTDSAVPVVCDMGTQDNDDNGICSASCTTNTCDYGTCDDSSGTATCDCDEGWAGETCDACAIGWREVVTMINTPRMCELDTPATTNMRMWLDGNDNASFTYSAGDVIEWRSRAPGGVGEVVDDGNAATRPSRVLVGSRRVVRFDGVDDRLQGLLDLRSATYSIFVVGSAAATDSGEQTFMHGQGETNINRNLRFLARSNAGSLRYRHGMPAGMDEVNITASSAAPVLMEAHRAEFLNGHALSLFLGQTMMTSATTQAAFDERLDIAVGRQLSGGSALEGDIAEIIVFVPAITGTARDDVRDYLKAKWNL